MSIYNISLKKQPNRTFTININNINYKITLFYRQITLFSLSIENDIICQNERCFANQLILPYRWQQIRTKGNFIFDTKNNEYPLYQNFNDTCLLYFLTEDELNE